MPNEKTPRTPAAKRTTSISSRSKKDVSASTGLASSNSSTSPSDEPVSTAQATTGTARNAIIQGNATIDLDEVRRRAYELYEERGRSDGSHEDDWYVAEREVRLRKQGSQSQNGNSRDEKKRA